MGAGGHFGHLGGAVTCELYRSGICMYTDTGGPVAGGVGGNWEEGEILSCGAVYGVIGGAR